MTDIDLQLQKLGLSNHEAKVYLATLKLGISKASKISQKSKISRENVYYILNQLLEKGFISEIIKSGIKHYSASSPSKLKELIEEEKEKKENTLKKIMPELNLLVNSSLNKPKIEFFEGEEGFKTIASKLLEYKNETIYGYVAPEILDYMPMFHISFRRKRREKNIKMKIITKKTKRMIEAQENDKKELRKTRFLNKIFTNSNNIYYILKNAIIIIKVNKMEHLGIYIEEEETAKLQKEIFKILWEKAESK